jgi:ATP/maltotriose-dependent transcriptional regulator MalT
MAANFINYIMMIIGIITILAAVIVIMIEKLKGEDIYFNIDVKEQELKKVIDDAEEIISELNYISDVVVQDIEEKMKNLQNVYANTKVMPVYEEAKPTKRTIPISFKSKTILEKPSTDSKSATKLSTKQQSVLECAGQGLSVMEIAKKLNMGQGEVSLILSLKNEVYQNE